MDSASSSNTPFSIDASILHMLDSSSSQSRHKFSTTTPEELRKTFLVSLSRNKSTQSQMPASHPPTSQGKTPKGAS